MPDIEAQVRQILRETLHVSDEQLTPTADVLDELGADSLDATRITMQLEETFGVEIPDEDAQKIRTVQELIECVRSHVPVGAKKR